MAKQKQLGTQVSMKVDREQYERLLEESKRIGRPVTWHLRIVLDEHLNRKEA